MAKKTATAKEKAPEQSQPATSAYASLIPEHQRFVDEYLVDFNATAAYMRVPGMTQNAKSASVQAARLLAKPSVQQAVRERSAATANRLEMTKDRIILEAARIALFDIRKLYRPDGSLKLPHELDDDTAAAIASIEIVEEFSGKGGDRELIGYTKKVKVVDKKGSVELAMKHLGLLKEKVEVDASDRMVALIQAMQGGALKPVANPPHDDD